MHHTRADIERPNLKRENGGRNLMQQKLISKSTAKTDWMLQLENTREKQKKNTH